VGRLIYLFEDYRLDTQRRELHRGAVVIGIEPQVFDFLEYLIVNRERVVSKEELITAIWRGRIISDSALTSRLNAARQALGDCGRHQRLIRTYPRKGLRFVGATQEQTDIVRPKLPKDNEPVSERPSIAILQFANTSRTTSRLAFRRTYRLRSRKLIGISWSPATSPAT
jgi:adenylate cyclase